MCGGLNLLMIMIGMAFWIYVIKKMLRSFSVRAGAKFLILRFIRGF